VAYSKLDSAGQAFLFDSEVPKLLSSMGLYASKERVERFVRSVDRCAQTIEVIARGSWLVTRSNGDGRISKSEFLTKAVKLLQETPTEEEWRVRYDTPFHRR
jgi:Ca2+-binding EF-hand superfamily protein